MGAGLLLPLIRRGEIHMAKSFTEDFPIGKFNVKVEVNRLGHGIKPELKNYFGRYGLDPESGTFDDINIPTGTIESIVFKRAVKSLRIGNDVIKFASANPIDDLPEDVGMGDEEDELDLLEEIFKRIVIHNRFLVRKAPYVLVFAQYAPQEVTEEEDPTPSESEANQEDTSTATRFSASDLKEGKTSLKSDG